MYGTDALGVDSNSAAAIDEAAAVELTLSVDAGAAVELGSGVGAVGAVLLLIFFTFSV